MDGLVCSACDQTYDIEEIRWRCDCGGVLNIEFEADPGPSAMVPEEPTMWRYRGAIPVRGDSNVVSLGEGFTPLREFRLAARTILVKEEYLNPTGSFKDRGASVLISKVKELGVREVIEDSSGNAGAAVAAYCRTAGVKCTVYVPEGVSREKAERIQHYGAKLKRVRGDRERCARAALRAANKTYYASHAYNPFFLQGTKTFAYEVCEQLDWRAPDAVVLPVGNGTLLLGAYAGFKDALAGGLIDDMPKLIGIQSKACAPLFHAFHREKEAGGGDIELRPDETMADGIAIPSPVRGSQILQAVRETRGNFFAVDDLEIIAALRDVASKGFQIEPTAAATIAGLARYLARGEPDDIVVTAFTGSNTSAVGY
jgi:threonine synthase